MKKSLYMLLASVLIICLFAGCITYTAPSEDSSIRTGNKDAEASPEEAAQDEDIPEETPPDANVPASLNLEYYLRELAHEHPDASPEELCDLMLDDPFFRMFWKESTEYYYPALNYEFQPEGVKDACCIWDAMQGTHAFIYVFEMEEFADTGALIKALESNVDPYWTETPLPNTVSFEEGNKVFFAMYPDDMRPVTGPIAEKARDFVEIFHTYLADYPTAAPLEIADYFLTHQKIAEMYTMEVEPGRLTGFGDFENEVEITGFDSGAILQPMMSPNTNIFYVFHVADGDDVTAFEQQLKDNANLVWNVCMSADTVITEIDGNYVLFMMCSEGTGN